MHIMCERGRAVCGLTLPDAVLMRIGHNKLGHYSDPNMEPSTLPSSPDAFAALLHDLRLVRRNRKHAVRTSNRARQTLSTTDRSAISAKTGGRCHVCGGLIEGTWHADHVFPYSSGGGHAKDNYLPAHALCKNYRWECTGEEIQHILKLEVWLACRLCARHRLVCERRSASSHMRLCATAGTNGETITRNELGVRVLL